MDQNIVQVALSALTGFTVKPRPSGRAQDSPDDGPSGRENSAFISQFKSLTTRDDQPAVRDCGLNELTTKNLIPTILPETVQSLRSTGGSVERYLPQNSLDSGPDDFTALKKELFVNMEEFFSPGYDHNFRGLKDPSECSRGGELYTRPWGWYRFALKVKDKYPEGNTWLGSPGWRNQSSPGEWPVSFHGTSLQGAVGITKEYYKPGPRDRYGYGIYSNPDIKTAEAYAQKFTSKTDGKTYKVVMQNRINPEKRKIIRENKDIWLIEIDRNATSEELKKISTESIRPYRILIKEV